MAIPNKFTTGGCGKVSFSSLDGWASIEAALPRQRKVNMRICCPNCESQLTHRSRKKGIFEYLLSAMIFVHPFRCEKCDSRFSRWSLREKPGPPRVMPTS